MHERNRFVKQIYVNHPIFDLLSTGSRKILIYGFGQRRQNMERWNFIKNNIINKKKFIGIQMAIELKIV